MELSNYRNLLVWAEPVDMKPFPRQSPGVVERRMGIGRPKTPPAKSPRRGPSLGGGAGGGQSFPEPNRLVRKLTSRINTFTALEKVTHKQESQ